MAHPFIMYPDTKKSAETAEKLPIAGDNITGGGNGYALPKNPQKKAPERKRKTVCVDDDDDKLRLDPASENTIGGANGYALPKDPQKKAPERKRKTVWVDDGDDDDTLHSDPADEDELAQTVDRPNGVVNKVDWDDIWQHYDFYSAAPAKPRVAKPRAAKPTVAKPKVAKQPQEHDGGNNDHTITKPTNKDTKIKIKKE
ncbi:hypothetical protein FN846DRAFT_998173 [Sphaerosporella brunnea]|uniref:Uncharacterized protein n=1 Tax=Sphaerosporella brunnea TaxID=1250544 RepID=A0A5J5EH16_9PEZI|nr:hypothetical protein FN846DRAFT_998173 [Sphaerosporella brunnea]